VKILPNTAIASIERFDVLYTDPGNDILGISDDFGSRRVIQCETAGLNCFDPVSIFLLIGWRVVNGWSRTQLLKNLKVYAGAEHPHAAQQPVHQKPNTDNG